MARTDKDRPYRVQAGDPTLPLVERHFHHASAAQRASRAGELTRAGADPRPCDLRPVGDRAAAQHRSSLGDACCDRHVAWWCWRSVGVPRWFRAHTWWEPERTRLRAGLRDAAKEYRATGGIDDCDLPGFQHRHCGRWAWD